MKTAIVLLACLALVGGCTRPPQPKTSESHGATASAGASRSDGSSGGLTAGQRLDRATADAERMARNGALTARVKAALANDVGLKTLKIDVDSDDGTVTLSGPVDSQDTRRRAQEAAKSVEGVHEVRNQLMVHDAAAASG